MVRRVLRKQLNNFFTELYRVQPEIGWNGVADQEFVDALADALVDHGNRQGKGVAFLQTLVHELQDRVNQQLKG